MTSPRPSTVESGRERRYVFLDCDGVINHRACFTPKEGRTSAFVWDPDCVERVNRICREADAVIVISSTWRKLPSCEGRLRYAGIDAESIIGKTPALRGAKRGVEINSWIFHNARPGDRFVILDDDSDDILLSQDGAFIKTSFDEGLTDAQADRAIETLRGEA